MTNSATIYINDIFVNISSTIRLYADDALMYFPVNDESNNIFQEDLATLTAWADTNQMFFNVTKCHSMFFSTRHYDSEIVHELAGEQLTRVTSFKYLGVQLTESLQWEEHINSVVLKANRKLGMLKRVLYKTPENIKLTAYKSLCRSSLEYASAVWDPVLSKHICKLEMVQHRAVRFIGCLRGICSVSAEREKLGLDTLENRRRENRKSILLNLIAGANCHPAMENASRELTCVFSNLGEHNTRLQARGVPSAVGVNTTQFLNSFFIRTMRDVRLS